MTRSQRRMLTVASVILLCAGLLMLANAPEEGPQYVASMVVLGLAGAGLLYLAMTSERKVQETKRELVKEQLEQLAAKEAELGRTLEGLTGRFVRCPDCGCETDSLKIARGVHRLVFVVVFAFWRMGTYVGCPQCIRRRVSDGLLTNLVTANVLWPIVLLVNWMALVRSYKPGHSRGAVRHLGIGGVAMSDIPATSRFDATKAPASQEAGIG